MKNSPHKYAAYIIPSMNIIITGVDDQMHEIIHSAFHPEFPGSYTLFQEGIATYYGGSVGKKFYNLVFQLNDFIDNNPNVDLSNIRDLNAVLEDGTNHFYTVGALLIDYALSIGGADMVVALFRHRIINQSKSDDPFDATNEILGLEKSQVDTFLRKYVKDYISKNSEIGF